MTRLRRSDPQSEGISRRRRGKGFSYSWPDRRPVDEPDVLERIRALAVPPAWTQVWICPWPNGHIQATGFDQAGRLQYLYHSAWRQQRDGEKFQRIHHFGQVLPKLRKVVSDDLQRTGLGRRRVLAAAVRLLDIGFFRVGSEEYADENDTYGVATLLKSHVERRGESLVFDYEGKGSKRRVIVITDPLLLPLIATLKRRRSGGESLLAWKGPRGWTDVRSADINSYIKQAAGDEFSAKDFRTWSATVMAAVCFGFEALGQAPTSHASQSPQPSAAQINKVVRQVADTIGDTPAVCRSSYISPAIVDRFREGRTLKRLVRQLAEDFEQFGDIDSSAWPERLDWPGRLDDVTRQAIDRSVARLLGD